MVQQAARIDKMLFPQRLQADFTHPNPNVVVAYTLCRTSEHAIDPISESDCWPPHNKAVKLKLIHVRVLGNLLSQSGFLSDVALSAVARDILHCRGEGEEGVDVENLNDLGEFYKDCLIRSFRKFKGQTSNIASEPSSASEPPRRLTKEEVSQMVFVTPRNCEESKNQAMVREDYRCIATRILDKEYARRLRMAGLVDESVEPLQCCYIFPESIGGDYEGKTRNRWTLLRRLGCDHLIDRLTTPEGIHTLDNVMMMTHEVQDRFDTLDLWFEPCPDVPNHYRVCSVWKLPHGLQHGHEVTFQSVDPRLPLPNPDYLAIHAACARVSHLSGASDLFAELEQDMEANPDPTVEETDFARALNARLENLHFTPVKGS